MMRILRKGISIPRKIKPRYWWLLLTGLLYVTLNAHWIPIPFESRLWRANVFRCNMISVLLGDLKEMNRADVIAKLGEPGAADMQGVESQFFIPAKKGGPLYYFIPSFFRGYELIIYFDAKDRVKDVSFDT